MICSNLLHSWNYIPVCRIKHVHVMQIAVRHGLSSQILKINERINELNENKETYQIESSPCEVWGSSSVETDPQWYI